ncbi:MAG: hypothetical protein IBX40_10190 [Methanosarcinales archaeon]|nr:hypothetical protein [Methanosarcinales archaeon]
MVGKCNGNTVVKTAFLNIDTPTLQEGLKSFEGTGVNRTMVQLGGADIELVYVDRMR